MLNAFTTPGGSSGQLQYHNAGVFGGAAALVYATSGTHLTATAQAATDVPLRIKAAGSQSANLLELVNSSDAPLFTINAAATLFAVANRGATSFGYSNTSGQTSTNASAVNLGDINTISGNQAGANRCNLGVGNNIANTSATQCNVGISNTITTPSGSAFCFGIGNSITSASGAAIGLSNALTGSDCYALGNGNQVSATRGVALGTNAVVSTAGLCAYSGVDQNPSFGLQRQSSTGTTRDLFQMNATWATSTDASRKGRTVFNIYDTAAREALRLEASGSAAMIGFLGASASVRQTGGENVTNNVTSGGTTGTIADYTIVDYATDAATIRNNLYQLARLVKQDHDALRLYGLLT